MRVFVGIVGLLFVLLGLGVGGLGALGVTQSDTGATIRCTTYPGDSSSDTTCNDDTAEVTREQLTGVSAVVGGAALLVGGCALVGGAVAGSGRQRTPAPTHPAPTGPSGYHP